MSTYEEFVTFFDHRFILQGLALHESLQAQSPGSRLWVICLSDEVEQHLAALELPGLIPVSLAVFETPELLSARSNRSWAEYVYTLTPFTFQHVFDADPSIRRVTYVDADVYFFRDPREWLRKNLGGARSVLITQHGYAPEYAHLESSAGSYCVQFLAVDRTPCGLEILGRWQRQCLESTSVATKTRHAVFGDQKYLEEWPRLYPDCVEAIGRDCDIQAPWNAAYLQGLSGGQHRPLLFHFHSLRLLSSDWVQLCAGYHIGPAMHLYNDYLEALNRQRTLLFSQGIKPPSPGPLAVKELASLSWRIVTGRVTLGRLSMTTRG